MAGFAPFGNFWRSMWDNLRVGDGTRREMGIQFTTPLGFNNPAALPVTEDTATQVSAVWACVRLLSETVASLPINVYKRTPNGREFAGDHWFYRLMKSPNQYQTRVEFMESMMLNLTLQGNCYALVSRRGKQVTNVLPIMSAQVQVRLNEDGTVQYFYVHNGEFEILDAKKVLHVKLFGNGIVGKSPMAFARNTLGVAQAAELAVTNIYNNGGKRSGVLKVDKILTPEQRDMIKANFANMNSDNSDRLRVLEAGMDFEAISMSPADIELLASRKFQIEEICRWFGVPSVLVNDTSGSTTWGSGIQQIVEGFYKLNLRPYLERFEASFSRALLGDEANEYEIEFDFDALLRSDMKTRLDSYKSAIQGSILTPNEARNMEGYSSLPGGDSLLAQVNMSPIENLGQVVTGGQTNAPQVD